MDWNVVEIAWRQVSAALLAKWPTLTADDLKFLDRTKAALLAKVRERTGLEIDSAERQLDELVAGLVASPAAEAKAEDAVPVLIPPSGAVEEP